MSALVEKFLDVDTLLAQESLHFADSILSYDSSWFKAKVLGENTLIKMLSVSSEVMITSSNFRTIGAAKARELIDFLAKWL